MKVHPETLAVHAGWNGDPTTHACAVPVYRTTAYNFDNGAGDLWRIVVEKDAGLLSRTGVR